MLQTEGSGVRILWGPTIILLNKHRGPFSGVKWPEREF